MSTKEPSEMTADKLYQELHEFFRSPIWILPVMSFVEQKSLIFDKDNENDKVLKEIHGEFRAIVDMLLSCFCEDLKVRHEDVVDAVEKARPKMKTETEKNMVEPVIAAHDYDVFLHMMMRKNIELQLQALQMLEVVYGIVPAVLIRGNADGSGDQEHVIMIEVMKKSKQEFDCEEAAEKEQLETALKESLSERDRLEKAKAKEQEMLHEALRSSAKEAAHEENSNSKKSVAESTKKKADKKQSDAEDAKKRKAYLLQQRDRLLEMKRQERKKVFDQAETETKPSRPRTAKAARTAMAGRQAAALDTKTIESRKALAEKLRTVMLEDDN